MDTEALSKVYTDVPIEIRYIYAQYFNLIDLYSVLKTCKRWNQITNAELGFQKICFNNTQVSRRYRNRTVRRIFQINRATLGIRNDDPAYLIFLLPTGSCKEVAEMLEQTDAPSFTAYKDAILCDIRDFDAERVLLELILYCSQYENIVDLCKVAAILGNVFLKMNGSFNVLIDLNKKHATLNLVLDFMKTHQNVILRSLIECTDNWWYKSNMPLIESCRRMLQYQRKFPQYAFDLNAPLQKHSNSGTQLITPLEYAVISGNEKIFDLLLEYGATFNRKAPFLALLYYHFGLGRDQFRTKLYNMGADLLVPLPPYISSTYTSILNHALSLQSESSEWLVEHLLYKGAKLLPEEEVEYLKEPENSPKFLLAKNQHAPTPCNAFESISEITGVFKLKFHNPMFGSSLVLECIGDFTLDFGHSNFHSLKNKYKGSYRAEEDKLVLMATQKEIYVRNDSYTTEFSYFQNIDTCVFRMIAFKTCTNALGVVLEAESDNIERMLETMMLLRIGGQ